MKRLLTRAALRLNKLKLAGANQVITCVIGRQRGCRARSTLLSNCRRHHSRLHRRAHSAVDALIRQHEQRRTRSQFDCHPDSNGLHRQYASDDFSKHPFEVASEAPGFRCLALPLSKSGAEYAKED